MDDGSVEGKLVQYAQLERLAVERGAILRSISRILATVEPSAFNTIGECASGHHTAAAASGVPAVLLHWSEDQHRSALERALLHQHSLLVSTLVSEVHRHLNAAVLVGSSIGTAAEKSQHPASHSTRSDTTAVPCHEAPADAAFSERRDRSNIEQNEEAHFNELVDNIVALITTYASQAAEAHPTATVLRDMPSVTPDPPCNFLHDDTAAGTEGLTEEMPSTLSPPSALVQRDGTTAFNSSISDEVPKSFTEEEAATTLSAPMISNEEAAAAESIQRAQPSLDLLHRHATELQVLEVQEARARSLTQSLRLDFFQLQMEEVHHRIFVERWAARLLVADTLSVIVETCNISCHRLYHESTQAGDVAFTAEAYRVAMDRHQSAQCLTMLRQRAADWMKALIPRAGNASPKKAPTERVPSSNTLSSHGEPDESAAVQVVPPPPPPQVVMSPRKPSMADRVARFDALRKAREVRHAIGLYSPKRPVQVLPLQEAL